jgi:hypothetical protein
MGADRHDDLIARFDPHLERFDVLLERNNKVVEANTRAWGHAVGAFMTIEKRIEDQRDEIRAQTRSILRLLDRLDGGEAPA